MSTASADFAHIRDLVRKEDQDRYWSALWLPRPQRDHLLTLCAFNIELARLADHRREPALAPIRLQWWHDAIAAQEPAEAFGHPAVAAMRAVCAAYQLPEGVLHDMIEARSFDLTGEPMPDMAQLEHYLARTAGSMFKLGAHIAGCQPDAGVELAAQHAAIAYGLTGLMRALPFHASRGQLFLPATLLAGHGVELHSLFRGEESEGLIAALRILRERALAAYDAFRADARRLPPSCRPVFAPLALVRPYIARMASEDYAPMRELVQINPLKRFALIAGAGLMGRF